MTETKLKVRSLFLTALMVMSVFAGAMAFSGTVGAANTATHNVDPATEGTTGATYTHEINAAGSLERVVADLDLNDNGTHDLSAVTTSDITVLVDGEEYTGTYSGFSADSASGEVRFNLDTPQDVTSSVTVIVGDVGNPSVDADTTFTQETRLYSDASADTVMDSPHAQSEYTITDGGTATDGGDADPPYESDDYDATFDTGENRWNGQSLYFNANNTDSDDTYELHETDGDTVGQMVTEVGVDNSTQETLISTSNLDGDYVITDGNGNVLETDSSGTVTGNAGSLTFTSSHIVTVVEQTFSASFDDNNVGQGSDVSFSTDSNRANYDVLISSDGLSDSELAETFSAAGAEQVDGGAVVPVDSNQDTISGTLPSDASTGNHSVDFTVVDTGASDSDNLDVGSGAPSASFSQSVYTEMRGDLVTVTVDLQNVDSANVRVGSPDVNYNTTLQLNDGDGDGQVTFTWNTWEAGKNSNEGVAFEAVGDDSVTNVQRFSEDIPSGDRLSAAEYDLTASLGDTETDVSVIALRERATDGASQHVAPNAAGYGNATELRSITSESSEVAWKDQTVTQVTASGLYGYLNASELEQGGAHGVSMTVEQSGDQINQSPKQVSLDSDGVDVVMDEQGNNVYLVVDSDSATAQRGNEAGLALEPGETYDVTFEIDGDENPYVPEGETETVTTQFTVTERTAEFDVNSDDEIIVSPASDQSISGTTSVAPGTEMSIRVKSTGSSPFLKTDSVTVQDDGTFSGTFDFSNVSENTTFTATVPNQGFSDNAETQGRVGQPSSASVSISDQSSDGSTVTVDSAELSHGGFVTIHDSSLQDGDTFESVRGTSDYLSEGSHSNVEVSLDEPYSEDGTVIAMPHQDTNDNQAYDFVDSEGSEDGPYESDGEAVTDSAELTIETPTPEPGTDTGTETETETETDTDTTDEPTDSPTPSEQPGFGLIVALVALAGAALLALRRD